MTAGLAEGERIGRFVVLRDCDGKLYAVASGSVGAICEIDDGTLLLLPGGRMLKTNERLATILAWLDGRPAC